ncbi:Signal peptidase complex subunit 2 [Cladobotryum mycophilum]|uniref:Signal peptidase complex subunit 2 n=1 Tax=Cladobotryum mycophilum TaxID=491253 RepID=A0ABR0S9S6_9HYPO
MANSSEKISLYNLAADDAIPNYLNSLKFKQSNVVGDVKLALGYSAFFIAAACFAWDYKLGFETTKLYTTIAVSLYMLLNGALTLWITFVEKGVVYQGTSPSGEKISITSATKKNEPIYKLAITITPKSSKPQKFEVTKPFATFFDESGYFVAVPFQEILATTVPVIGQRDPKRNKTESQKMLDANPELLNAYLASTTEGSTGVEAVDDHDGKRRKH